MTTTQMIRYQRRAQREAQRRAEMRERVLFTIAMIVLLALFGIAGGMDYQSEVAYLNSWYEANGVN